MSTTVKTGWLKDNQGNNFAPKTLSSQVFNNEGILLEDQINTNIAELENTMVSAYETKSDASAKFEEAKTYTDISVDTLSDQVAYIDEEDNEDVSDDITHDIVVDSELSMVSTNPVQNKVITAKINQLSNDIANIGTGGTGGASVQFITWEADD